MSFVTHIFTWAEHNMTMKSQTNVVHIHDCPNWYYKSGAPISFYMYGAVSIVYVAIQIAFKANKNLRFAPSHRFIQMFF